MRLRTTAHAPLARGAPARAAIRRAGYLPVLATPAAARGMAGKRGASAER